MGSTRLLPSWYCWCHWRLLLVKWWGVLSLHSACTASTSSCVNTTNCFVCVPFSVTNKCVPCFKSTHFAICSLNLADQFVFRSSGRNVKDVLLQEEYLACSSYLVWEVSAQVSAIQQGSSTSYTRAMLSTGLKFGSHQRQQKPRLPSAAPRFHFCIWSHKSSAGSAAAHSFSVYLKMSQAKFLTKLFPKIKFGMMCSSVSITWDLSMSVLFLQAPYLISSMCFICASAVLRNRIPVCLWRFISYSLYDLMVTCMYMHFLHAQMRYVIWVRKVCLSSWAARTGFHSANSTRGLSTRKCTDLFEITCRVTDWLHCWGWTTYQIYFWYLSQFRIWNT